MRILIIIFSLLTLEAHAQVNVLLNEPSGVSTSISELFNISVISSSKITVLIKGTITNTKGDRLVEAHTRSMVINSGVNSFTEKSLNPNYSLNKTNMNNNLLAYGEYVFCISIVNAATLEEVGEDCKNVKVSLLNPPFLINPFNEEVISSRFPLFVWAPPTPFTPSMGLTYDFKLCEVRKGQNINDALSRNKAIFSRSSLTQNNYQYIPANYPLDTGIVYCWGVAVKNSYNEIVGVTEVWSFKVIDATDYSDENKVIKGFVNLSDQKDGIPITIKDELKIIYNERYAETIGTLTIRDQSGNKVFQDRLTVLQGENRYAIDQNVISNLKKGKNYYLSFSPEGRAEWYLIFKIIKP